MSKKNTCLIAQDSLNLNNMAKVVLELDFETFDTLINQLENFILETDSEEEKQIIRELIEKL